MTQQYSNSVDVDKEDEEKRLAYLHAMDIPVWQLREGLLRAGPQHRANSVDPVAEPKAAEPKIVAPIVVAPIVNESKGIAPIVDAPVTQPAVEEPAPLEAVVDWKTLQQQVATCTTCELHQSRTQTVFGIGDHQADLLVIGEAPGEEEDKQGVPFVGPAGQLLDAMLKAIDLNRNKVFIANILKCRPPGNRDPKSVEVEACRSFLLQQIAFIQPKLILAVGRIAAQNLLLTDTAIGKLRGPLHKMPDTDIPVLVTYHPAYLLRAPREKAKAWEDLKQVVLHLGRTS